jgi:hypothetical protein
MLGGGSFTSQNKILPGAYVNFVSLATASATLSDRGVATMPLELDWGVDGEVFEVTNEEFQKNSLKVFGYAYNDAKLKGLRDLFKNIRTLYAYRLNGEGEKATCMYATAKYSGVRGNDIKIVIQNNIDAEDLFDVQTILGNTVVDVQTVNSATALVDNDFVTFKTDADLTATAGVALTGGANGTVDGNAHQTYLDKIESYSFNALGVIATEDSIKSLYVNFCKRLRDEVGAKFQCVVYNKAADYEGVVNVKNKTTDEGWSEACLVYWVTGIIAGCEISKSNLNRKYDGEFTVDVDYTQTELIQTIKDGEFTLHKVGSSIRVLDDINSLVTTTDTKGDIFKNNQTIRVIDQCANDDAVLFNTKYLGVVPNDESGRISLWTDIVKHREQLQSIRAIEEFNDKDVVVTQGDTKNSVVINGAIQPVNSMAKLYMTTVVR